MDTTIRSACVMGALLLLPTSSIVAVKAGAAQPAADTAQVELRPGVVIDTARQIAFVSHPKAGIDAIRLAKGDLAWHSDEAARPLAVAADAVVAQVEVARPTNELVLRTLDARTGRTRRAITHALPQGTRAMVMSNAESTFTMQALPAGTAATLTWQFQDRPLQGVRPGALEIDRPPGDAERLAITGQAATATRAGVVRVDVAAGRAVDAPGTDTAALAVRRLDAPAESRVSGVTGDQFVSVDARHVLSSERLGDDSMWEKYQWTIFERSSGRRIGAVRDYRSHAPFIVVGSSIVYEIGPVERRTEQGLVAEPLRLRAVDLAAGAQLWAREIRDLEYRGPFPP